MGYGASLGALWVYMGPPSLNWGPPHGFMQPHYLKPSPLFRIIKYTLLRLPTSDMEIIYVGALALFLFGTAVDKSAPTVTRKTKQKNALRSLNATLAPNKSISRIRFLRASQLRCSIFSLDCQVVALYTYI